MTRSSARRASLLSTLCFALVLSAPFARSASAAEILIVNLDEDGEGLNDPSPATPVGGNTGETLGDQRLIALEYAAALWAEQIRSPVPILVDARFNPLGGGPLTATIGFAANKTSHRDFAGAPLDETFYVAALANSLAREDLAPNNEDIRIRMNSDIDGLEALGPRTFYYGLDANPGTDIDFVTAALHELAHGLGFTFLADLETGALKSCGQGSEDRCADAYLANMVNDAFSPSGFVDMSDSQRSNAAVDEPNVVWGGSSATGSAVGMTGGIDDQDRIVLHAPTEYAAGVSGVHVTSSATPSQLMEPGYSSAIHEIELATLILRDSGWRLISDTTTTTTSTSTTTSTLGAPSCGDPSGDGEIRSTDALIVLNAAVDLTPCALSVCDVDAGGSITSTDAVRVLRFAVGEDVQLVCN